MIKGKMFSKNIINLELNKNKKCVREFSLLSNSRELL
jgi:hypothetical protein